MAVKQRHLLAIVLVLMLVVVTACSGNDNGGNNGAKADNDHANNGAAADNSAGNDGKNDKPADTGNNGGNAGNDAAAEPLGKYDPPIEVSTVRIINDTYKFAEGDTIDNNVWYKAYADELGIKIKNDWVVSGDGVGGPGEQKMNVSIASGDLPDIIPVNPNQLQQLIDADLVMDMTDVFEKYASPLTKEIMNADGGYAMKSASSGGKLMALPNTGSSMDGAAMIWLRSDWLKKLNLPEPKTMDDVYAIIDAFTNQDPDGNNKKDTVGIALNKDIMGGYAGLDGFFNAFHAYPGIWFKDASGKLVNGSVQPETKAALAKLAELYKSGQIDKEFGVKDGGKAGESQGAGKNGFSFGQMWNPLWPMVSSKDNDPNAEWQSYPLASVDDQPARPQVTLAVGGYYAVNKKAKHPEAAVKLMNLYIEKSFGESSDPNKYGNANGLEVFKYAIELASPPTKNLDAHKAVTEALKSGDASKLNPEQTLYYDKISSYLKKENGTNERWAYDRVFGETGSFVVIDKYVSENLLMNNEFYGAPTPTMVSKGSSLKKMELEVFTKIIMGSSPIDAFDKFVKDWNSVGGEAMTKEVNEWYQAQQ
ncbi:extracellular solute-binding protein [Paenibacillus sacheonensis]|uniref:Extracellular solute-binding protein n=1 Tax=Paenibacillus sacheonensis TaxID=742054 RepID=A0A7X4YL48_9BACL|nr:extracellular solute-binding protein [Paenibacillus sacheonensis]MBM7564258.1 putative aldouronate transport system substrate-binding protein [Paenibacillus sacheonensis]NBC67419.1 extracellular solute-binding protein [Paenibacillus sacheonensis]